MRFLLSYRLKGLVEENMPKIRTVMEERRRQGIGLSELANRGELTWVLPFHLLIAEQKMIGVIDVDDPTIVWNWIMDHGRYATVHATQIIERRAYTAKYGEF